MTKKEIILKRKKEGKCSPVQVAKELDCSKQYVSATIYRKDPKNKRKYRSAIQVCFPGLNNYLEQNNLSCNELYELMNINTTYETIRNKLCGRRPITKPEIDAILKVTGMTYEECFTAKGD